MRLNFIHSPGIIVDPIEFGVATKTKPFTNKYNTALECVHTSWCTLFTRTSLTGPFSAFPRILDLFSRSTFLAIVGKHKQ